MTPASLAGESTKDNLPTLNNNQTALDRRGLAAMRRKH
jgi:hypothetical protein